MLEEKSDRELLVDIHFAHIAAMERINKHCDSKDYANRCDIIIRLMDFYTYNLTEIINQLVKEEEKEENVNKLIENIKKSVLYDQKEI